VAISGNDVLVGDDTQNGIGGAAYLFGLQPRSGSLPWLILWLLLISYAVGQTIFGRRYL